jgi:uncharacterized protein HemX
MDTMNTTLAPTPEPAETTHQRRRWPLVVGAAAIAGVVGLGVGYMASGPQRTELTDQRDAAQAALVEADADLAAMEDQLGAVEEDLASVTGEKNALVEENESVTENRDQCEVAAVTGSDLVSQWENLWVDLDSYLWSEVGSEAEAEIDTHMNEQWQKMEEQHNALHSELDTCTAG